jgi:hypothetical protein
MRDVYIRQKQLHGKVSKLVRCQVLAQNGDTLRVTPEGSKAPIEVKVADTVPANKMSGANDKMTIVPKQYPTAPGAMHNRVK